ncbi:MAG: hypothetical protein ACNA7O_09750 [Rhodobacterales bacterium]
MLEDFEKKYGSILSFLNGKIQSNEKKTRSIEHSRQSRWRQVEEWSFAHPDPYIQLLGRRAFDLHDQEAMNELRAQYDWELRQAE